jgi:hypothetical protein
MVSNRGPLVAVIPMLHQERLNTLVMLQNPNEFRSAVATMSDNSDLNRQVIEYSFL